MKFVKIILVFLLVVSVGIQFVPTKRNLSLDVSNTDFILVNKAPNRIESLIKISCYDCHSNNTNYPWYNKIQPIAWILEDHIFEGKKELNLNEWGDYSDRRKRSKLKSIISQINDDKMPLATYTLIHRTAILSESDKDYLIKWINKLINGL